jgi:hypothetical protein
MSHKQTMVRDGQENNNCIHTSEINQNDVLMGKGGLCTGHLGTIAFKVVVETRLGTYCNVDRSDSQSKKNDKTRLTLQIVHLIHTSGGRFLKKEHNGATSELWCVLSKSEARVKVRDTFRDGLKNIRKHRRPSALLDKMGLSERFSHTSSFTEIVEHIAKSSDILHFIFSRNSIIEQRRQREIDSFFRKTNANSKEATPPPSPYASGSTPLQKTQTTTIAPIHRTTNSSSSGAARKRAVFGLAPPQPPVSMVTYAGKKDAEPSGPISAPTISTRKEKKRLLIANQKQMDIDMRGAATTSTAWKPGATNSSRTKAKHLEQCRSAVLPEPTDHEEECAHGASSLSQHYSATNYLALNTSADEGGQSYPLLTDSLWSPAAGPSSVLHQQGESAVTINTARISEHIDISSVTGVPGVSGDGPPFENRTSLSPHSTQCSISYSFIPHPRSLHEEDEDLFSVLSTDDHAVSQALERAILLGNSESCDMLTDLDNDSMIESDISTFLSCTDGIRRHIQEDCERASSSSVLYNGTATKHFTSSLLKNNTASRLHDVCDGDGDPAFFLTTSQQLLM